MTSLTCGVDETKDQNQRNRDQIYGYQRQRGGGMGNWRKVVKRYTLPVLRPVSTRDVTYHTQRQQLALLYDVLEGC